MDPRNPTCMESLAGAAVGSLFIGICMAFLSDSWLIEINIVGCTLTVIAIYGFANWRWKRLDPEERNRQWEKYQGFENLLKEIKELPSIPDNQSREYYIAEQTKLESMRRVLDDYQSH